jgi:hypothetical protein
MSNVSSTRRSSLRRTVGLALTLTLAMASSQCGGGGDDSPLFSNPGPSTTSPAPSSSAPTTASGIVVAATGGSVATADGKVKVDVPAGALPSDLTITITATSSAPNASAGTVYEIGPTGTQFATPVTLTFSYAGVDLTGHTVSDLLPGRVVEGQWQVLSDTATDTATSTVHGTTTHLSAYGVFFRSKDLPNGNGNGNDAGSTTSGGDDASTTVTTDSGTTSGGGDAGTGTSSDAATTSADGGGTVDAGPSCQAVGACQIQAIQGITYTCTGGARPPGNCMLPQQDGGTTTYCCMAANVP